MIVMFLSKRLAYDREPTKPSPCDRPAHQREATMPRRDSDRNLLFGILALQMDFITRDALIASMGVWVLEKHRTIGEILVEQNALGLKERDALEAMLVCRLAKHGDDPARSLAALSSAESIAADLQQALADPEVQASIGHVPVDPHATRAPETVDYIPPHIRYRKVRDHAKGGLGIVYVALDGELKREVALKEIKPEYADNLASQSRFLLEAEITGGLEHPGIVPVYGLGAYDDGRPFYAMRFIKGDSLKDAIAVFHADPTLKKDPGARALALQKLLRRFLDVCNAVAYAHSRGVLHRDLKPDNVMVGKYGETLVVDWGLAKAIGRSGADGYGPLPESTLLYTSSGSAQTMPGSVVGTPGYMSPEQAAGRLDLLGPASDVYGLGATLYTLLTGRLPFAGHDVPEILRKVERGEFPRPRESALWLDPALEAITLKAMALKPEARYASPRALAEDVERWIADEPVAAYPEPFNRRVRRWAKKHRTSLTTATAAALVGALLIGGFAWQRLEHRRQTDDAGRTILAKAEGLATQARTSGEMPTWDKAVAEATLARERLESGDGSPALLLEAEKRLKAFRVDQAHRAETLAAEARDEQVVTAIEEARLQGANVKDGTFDIQAKIDAYLVAFQAYGIDVATLPVEDAARRIRSSRKADDLIESLDDWTRYDNAKNIPKERLEAIARAAETDSVRATIREAVSRRDAEALRRFCESEEDRRKLGPRVRHIFDSLLRLDPVGSFPLLETILREHPSDFWLNHHLGAAYLFAKPPKLAEAVHFLSVAVALRPDSPGVLNNLGYALRAQGHLDQAIDEFRAAIRIKPDYAEAHTNFGITLEAQGQLDQAIAEHRAALRIKPDYAEAHTNLGNALKAQGQLDQAIAEYRTALRIKPDLPEAHLNLGNALKAQGQLDQAIAEYRAAIRIKPDYPEAHYGLGAALGAQGQRDQSIAEFRAVLRIKPDYAEAHYILGLALKDKGQRAQAIAEYRAAIRIKPDYAQAHLDLGAALGDEGQLDQAIDEYRAALRIKPELLAAHVNLGHALKDKGQLDQAIAEYRAALRIKPDYAQANYSLGLALSAQGQLDQAIAEYRAALRIKPDYAEAHTNLGGGLSAQGQLDQAIAEYRAAIHIKPDLLEAHVGLGFALKTQGQLDQAIAEYRIALRIKPNHAEAHFYLGKALAVQGQLDQAIAEYRAALRVKPEDAEAHFDLGAVLQAQGQLDQAIAEYRAALRIKPDDVRAHTNLGAALSAQGQLDQAIAEYRAALRIKPVDVRAHTNLGLALKTQGQLDQAIAEFHAVLRIKPDHHEAHYNLGNVLKDQGHLDQAIAEYRAAIGIKPNYAEAHCNLGLVFLQMGKFGEALESLEKGHALGSKQPGWRHPSEAWVRNARRLVDLEAKLPAILKGEVTPKDSAERLLLADLCHKIGRHATSARFWGEAFAETPALADDLAKGHRYNAACSASLAGSSQGKDDPLPDEAGRVKLREQALGWLRADLAAWAKVLDGGNEPARKQLVAKTLAHWKGDADLAGIRDEAALAKLPEAEREAFRSLWADVEELRAKAGGAK
jgi:tetratricopeptide (TPR) repeat protein/tRNA A-37 threonylcarbamoyl transferase component Bud32